MKGLAKTTGEGILCKESMAVGVAFTLLVPFVIGIHVALGPVNAAGNHERVFSNVNNSAGAQQLQDLNDDDGSMNRIGAACSKDNILVFQGPTSPLPNGIPVYTVQIQNVCVSGSCSISNIHLSCGWFSSARLINPKVFRRIDYDDCLVNDGGPLNPGECLTFQYANSFQYPLAVTSVTCY